MGIPLGSSFTRTAGVPLDDTMKVADNTARDAIASGVRYEGMIVYSVADGVHYALIGGITNGDWNTIAGGGAASNLISDLFSGDGSDVTFTLSADPVTELNTWVFISGVFQNKNTYSIAGTTLTFSQAPPIGTNNIEVMQTAGLSIGVPGNDTVSTIKIQDDAVTTPKIPDNAVTTPKIPVKTYANVTAAVGEIAYSNSCATFAKSGSGIVDITNLTVTITTRGGAVELWLEPVQSATLTAYFGILRSSNQMGVLIYFLKGATVIGKTNMEIEGGTGDTSVGLYEPPTKFRFTDRSVIGVAGTYTYKIQVELTATSGGATFYAQDTILYGKEV